MLLILAVPLVFPEGRAPGRGPVALVAACVSAFTIATLVAPVPMETRLETVANPLGLPPSWKPLADLLALGALAAAFIVLLVAVTTLVRRWRSGGGLVRQQILVFGMAFAVPLLLLPLVATPWAQPWMFALVTLPMPVAVAVAVFQRRLYDLQLAANRTLTYLALSVVLAALYALVVGGVGVVLHDSGAPWLPLAAAGVVAVVFAPLRDSLQPAANRLTHGRWSTPAEVLADTGRRLAEAADGPALLDSLTHELVHGLGLAHAEIRDTSGRRLAATGTTPGEVETLPGRPVDDRIARLRADLQDTVTEVRRIVEGLRPAAIDELGLFGAVAELAHQLTDGSGGAWLGRGVGWHSMRERAREIGGRIEVDSPSGGTTVTIRLPLPVEPAT